MWVERGEWGYVLTWIEDGMLILMNTITWVVELYGQLYKILSLKDNISSFLSVDNWIFNSSVSA